MRFDPIEFFMNGHGGFGPDFDDFPGGGMDGRDCRGPGMDMPGEGPDFEGGMPQRHGGRHGFGHGMPGRRGFGRGCRNPFGGQDGQGMPPFAGPRRPNPDFLKRRVAESDAMELLDMAGRMSRRLPQGGAARGQALILSILAGRESLSQRELQQMLGIQPGSLSELLSKLEAKGCLTREKGEDRRGNLLRITEEGRRALPNASEAPEDDLLAPLTGEQQDQLTALLRTLVSAWIDRLEPACPRGERPTEL